MLVQEFLQASAAQRPEKVALVCDGRRFTYAELDRLSNRLARALTRRGVQRGDRVAIWHPNSLETVVGIFAILKAGAVFVVVNHTTKPEKLLGILNNCRAVALLADARTHPSWLVTALPEQAPSVKLLVLCGDQKPTLDPARVPCLHFQQLAAEAPDTPLACPCIDLDLACLIYTSGSTGEAKGVMSDHSNVVFAASSIIEYLHNVTSDVVLNVLPLSFDYGLYQLLMTFKFGGTLVLEKSFAFPAVILKRIQEERVTGLPGVPTIFAMLMPMDLSTFDLSSLRYLTNTAAALPASHIQGLRRKFPQATLYSMYGLTETKRTLYLPPDQLDRRPDSVGIPIPGTEAWLEDEAGVRLGPGQIGQLVVRGRHVMRGYWEAPEATARRFRPGPLPGERVCCTGDLFRMDEEGYFYFVGRQDDIIKSRGEKVAPKEIENVLCGLGGVREAAVIGVPDPVLGQAIKAWIVASDPQLSQTAVLAYCKRNLEDFMVPKYVEFRRELPRTASCKIQKRDLA